MLHLKKEEKKEKDFKLFKNIKKQKQMWTFQNAIKIFIEIICNLKNI